MFLITVYDNLGKVYKRRITNNRLLAIDWFTENVKKWQEPTHNQYITIHCDNNYTYCESRYNNYMCDEYTIYFTMTMDNIAVLE